MKIAGEATLAVLAFGILLAPLAIVGCRRSLAPDDASVGQAYPHFAPTKKASQPAIKGMDLYSWQGQDGLWRFSLLYGTNRAKPRSMITDEQFALTGLDALKAGLDLLAKGESVGWTTALPEQGEPELELPPREVCDEIGAYCENLGVDLWIDR